MHCLIFIKCSTTDEDYQIRNTQHSKVLNHLGVANQRLYKLHVQDKNQKPKTKNQTKPRKKEKTKTKTKKLTSQCITPIRIKYMALLQYKYYNC